MEFKRTIALLWPLVLLPLGILIMVLWPSTTLAYGLIGLLSLVWAANNFFIARQLVAEDRHHQHQAANLLQLQSDLGNIDTQSGQGLNEQFSLVHNELNQLEQLQARAIAGLFSRLGK